MITRRLLGGNHAIELSCQPCDHSTSFDVAQLRFVFRRHFAQIQCTEHVVPCFRSAGITKQINAQVI